MGVFEFKNAEAVRQILGRNGVNYLFIGKCGAVLLGFSDTTQDVDLFAAKNPDNCCRLASALMELGFALSEPQAEEIRRGKDFVQLRNGPFDLDVIFAPDGIERFEDAWQRRVEVHGLPVCSIDDIIASKEAANRQRDRESLPRLRQFRDWLKRKS